MSRLDQAHIRLQKAQHKLKIAQDRVDRCEEEVQRAEMKEHQANTKPNSSSNKRGAPKKERLYQVELVALIKRHQSQIPVTTNLIANHFNWTMVRARRELEAMRDEGKITNDKPDDIPAYVNPNRPKSATLDEHNPGRYLRNYWFVDSSL